MRIITKIGNAHVSVVSGSGCSAIVATMVVSGSRSSGKTGGEGSCCTWRTHKLGAALFNL